MSSTDQPDRPDESAGAPVALGEDGGPDGGLGGGPGGGAASRAPSAWRRWLNKWARTLHVYTSMIALLAVLFFAFSGLTLNHPNWTLGDATNERTVEGVLPIPTKRSDGSVDFLAISEYMRSEYGVNGLVDSFDESAGEGSIAYRNAGYAADLFFTVETGRFTLNIEQQGWVGVMNDLHKGRHTRSTWNLVIDIVAVVLIVISLTGLVMQFFLRKRRRSALISAAVGVVVLIGLMLLTLR